MGMRVTNNYNVRFTLAVPRPGKMSQWTVVLQVTDKSKDNCIERATALVEAVGVDSMNLHGPYRTRDSFVMNVRAGFYEYEEEATSVQRMLNRRLIQLEIMELQRQLKDM